MQLESKKKVHGKKIKKKRETIGLRCQTLNESNYLIGSFILSAISPL